MSGRVAAVGVREVDNGLDQFLRERIRGHQKDTIHCSTCVAVDQTECLPKSVKFGQRPSKIVFYDGADPYHPADLLGIRAPTTFFSTSKIISFPQAWDPLESDPNLAAASYAVNHLGVRQLLVFGSTRNPTAQQLVDYFYGISEASRFTTPYLTSREAEEIYLRASGVARSMGRAGDTQALYALTSLEITRHNAAQLQAFVAGMEVEVAAGFIDSENATMRRIDTNARLDDLFLSKANECQAVGVPKLYNPSALVCSCCDARANGKHLFNARPGEFLYSNTISVLLPPHNALMQGQRHIGWSDIDLARQKGLPVIVLGHSGCGGIQALVDRHTGRRTDEAFLDPWLSQADMVVENVLDFAGRHGVTGTELYELTAKEIKKWSGRNVAAYLKNPSRVRVYYLELDTRNVQRLDPFETIDKTFARMREVQTLAYVCHEPPPKNVYQVPSACPPRQGGAPREHDPRHNLVEWLFRTNHSCLNRELQ